jgi:hypothetical protein
MVEDAPCDNFAEAEDVLAFEKRTGLTLTLPVLT